METNRHKKGTVAAWRIMSVSFLVSLVFSLWNLIAFNFSGLPKPLLMVWVILSIIGLVISIAFLREDEPAFMYWVQILVGIFYMITVLDLTWFSRAWTPIWSSEEVRAAYFQNQVNFEPFHTIRMYIFGYREGYFGIRTTVANLIGNVILLAPAAFFVPYLSKPFRKVYFFLPFILGTGLVIEGVQMLFTCGSLDMDDLILNVGGGMIAWLLCKLFRIWDRAEKLGWKKHRSDHEADEKNDDSPRVITDKPNEEELEMYVPWKKKSVKKAKKPEDTSKR